MAETTRVLITDDDIVTAVAAATDVAGGPWTDEVRDALEAVAPRLRGRWVAEALEDAANEWNPAVLDDSGRPITATLRELAAEYRAGTR